MDRRMTAVDRVKRNLKACRSIFRIQLATGLQYRAAAFSGAVVSVFWALIEIIVYTVFFRFGDRAGVEGIGNGMALSQVVSYQWLSQFLALIQFGGIDGEILRKIDSGDVGVELCRPLGLYGHWFSRSAAGRLVPLCWRGAPILLVGALMPAAYRLQTPASAAGLLCALLSMLSAFVLNAAFVMLVTALRVNVSWGNGPMNVFFLCAQILSGAYIPLRLLPDVLRPFLSLQPFAGLVELPVQLYLGLLQPAQAVWTVGLQWFWSAVFILAGSRLLRKRLRNVVVQGG